MKTNEIENLLRQMKDDPDFGVLDSDSSSSMRTRVYSIVDTIVDEQPVVSSGVFDFMTSLPGVFTDMVARPVALMSMLMIMVLGGWITSVNASLDTLPGDTFYNVKLVSEKAQLVLASSSAKPKLHAEFASRRLNEITTLVRQEGDSEDRKDNVQTAIDGFNKQMDGVNMQLEESNDQETVIELARIIDQKSSELESVLELAEENVGDHIALTEAVESSEVVREKIVDTLVQQSNDSRESMEELSRQFTNEIRTINSQTATVGSRLDRIEKALETREDIEADLTGIVSMLATQDLSEAMDTAAAGGYIRAFELTTNIRRELRDATEQLIQLEIQLTHPAVEETLELEEDNIEETVLPDIDTQNVDNTDGDSSTDTEVQQTE